MNFNWRSIANSAKEILSKGMMMSKKNAPILLTGSSIAIGWFAVYLFWEESRKAEKRIAYDKKVLNEEKGIDPESKEAVDVPKKEKFNTYLGYCWPSLVMGLTSTGLAVAGQKISMDRIRDAYLMTQFLTQKSEKQEKLNQTMADELGEKKIRLQKRKVFDEDFSEEEILDAWNRPGAEGDIILLDHTMHIAKRISVDAFDKGVHKANDILLKRYRDAYRRYHDRKDDQDTAFFVQGDFSYVAAVANTKEHDENIYSTLDLAEFLQCFTLIPGDSFGARIGEINEFRCYDDSHNPITKEGIIQGYKDADDNVIFIDDPDSGEVRKVKIYDMEYIEYLCPTSELMERNPL